MSEMPLRCKCRRQAETSLRCSRCSVPICPDCSKYAAVGMICKPCMAGRQSPLYEVSGQKLALAFVACLPVAVLGGWLLNSMRVNFGGFYSLWLAFLYGLGVAEVALRVTNRRRGLHMAIVVGSCIALGIGVGWLLGGAVSSGSPAPNPLFWHLTQPWSLIILGVAVLAGASRVRDL